MKVCVFCSSSEYVDEQYFQEARDLGLLISGNQFELIYGGTDIGLMGALARSTKQGNGKITGVIPQLIYDKGIAFTEADNLLVTRDLRERKALMEKNSDAFIALPGGFGTLEELLEMITLKQLQLHHKPIVVINTAGYFNSLCSFFDHLYHQQFVSERFRGIFHFVSNSWEAIQYVKSYQPQMKGDKWSK